MMSQAAANQILAALTDTFLQSEAGKPARQHLLGLLWNVHNTTGEAHDAAITAHREYLGVIVKGAQVAYNAFVGAVA